MIVFITLQDGGLHLAELPSWAEACKLVLLVQPSSAAVERVLFVRKFFFTPTKVFP